MGAARAIWRGAIRFRNVDVPVRLYAAVQDRGVHFRLLHARDRTPVRQHMVNPSNGEEVPSDRVRRGLQVEPGVFVVLRKKERNEDVVESTAADEEGDGEDLMEALRRTLGKTRAPRRTAREPARRKATARAHVTKRRSGRGRRARRS